MKTLKKLRQMKYKLLLYFVCVIFVFIFMTIGSSSIVFKAATNLSKSHDPQSSFFWLEPKFSLIETGNLMLSWGGVISCIAGAFLPRRNLLRSSRLKNDLIVIIFLNMFCVIFSNITLYLYEMFTIPSLRLDIVEFDILQHSVVAETSIMIYITFWALIGYGLSINLKFRIFSALLGVSIQVLEYFYFDIHYPTVEKYLPLALSRQIVINSFPFWKINSWADIKGAAPFASMPMIFDTKNNVLIVSYKWIGVYLCWYLVILLIKPVIKNITTKEESSHVSTNSN